jgi:tetratricopeptide (TPR) repeat protein
MGKKRSWRREHLYLFFACVIMASIMICGCAHLYEGVVTRTDFEEASDFLKRGNFKASLIKYDQIIVNHPLAGDRALFEMGVIHVYARNPQKDYQKSLGCFQKLIKDYPESKYRKNSDVMVSLIDEVISKDKRIIAQRRQVDKLEQQIEELGKKIELMKEVDMTLKQKKKTAP